MCLSPKRMRNGFTASCRKCKRCRNNHLNDWVGRCIAEKKVSDETFALTLTYAETPANGAKPVHLQYADCQKLLKRLRFAGYRVRYLIAGEYGSERGRAHWHALLFFTGKVPRVVPSASDLKYHETERSDGQNTATHELVLPRFDNDPDARIRWSFWPHGFVYTQRPDPGGFRYVCKYMLKGDGRIATNRVMMSKGRATVAGRVVADDPGPLGWLWFRQRADDLAFQGLALRDWSYTHPEAVFRNGKPVEFWLQGRTRELFEREYLIAWTRYRRGPVPDSPLWAERREAERRKRMDSEDAIRRDLRWALDMMERRGGPKILRGLTSRDRKRLLQLDETGKVCVHSLDPHNIWHAEIVDRRELWDAAREGQREYLLRFHDVKERRSLYNAQRPRSSFVKGGDAPPF